MVMDELRNELVSIVVMALLIITQRSVMMEMHYQEMDEAHPELMSSEVMEL